MNIFIPQQHPGVGARGVPPPCPGLLTPPGGGRPARSTGSALVPRIMRLLCLAVLSAVLLGPARAIATRVTVETTYPSTTTKRIVVRYSVTDPVRGVRERSQEYFADSTSEIVTWTVTPPQASQDGVVTWNARYERAVRNSNPLWVLDLSDHVVSAVYDPARGDWVVSQQNYVSRPLPPYHTYPLDQWDISALRIGNATAYWTAKHTTGSASSPQYAVTNAVRGYDGPRGAWYDGLTKPLAFFVPSVSSGAAPVTVAFTNISLAATSFSWNFGDGAGSAATNPTHVFTAPGTYTTTLSVAGPGGQHAVSRTITVSAAPTPTRGSLDIVDANGIAQGWALDPGVPSQPLMVHFYVDGPAGQGAWAGATYANIPRPDVAPTPHGFRFSVPNQFRDGQPHRLYAYGIDATGDTNPLLSNSPKTFTAGIIRKVAGDFDGDGRTDLSVFRPGDRFWYALLSSSNALWGAPYGFSTDTRVPGDYDGDGKTDLAVVRSESDHLTWYPQGSLGGLTVSIWGLPSDAPVPADYDGDGKTDTAVVRSTGDHLDWYLLGSLGGFRPVQFGQPGDMPVPADYDGDGKADVAVFRPGDGTWYVQRSRDGLRSIQFGAGGDVPVPADYDGDGKADLAVWRPSDGVWYTLGSAGGAVTATRWGQPGDKPTPGDYDGDGKTDLAVVGPAGGYAYWSILRSSDNTQTQQQFGYDTDIPLLFARPL